MEDDDVPKDSPAARAGVVPAIAGMAAYQGLPSIVLPGAMGAYQLARPFLSNGVPITAEAGTPLERIAEFSRAEVEAIKNFAQQRGVTMPIVAAPSGYSSTDGRGPISKLLSRLRGDEEFHPRIAIGTTSMPEIMHEIGHASPILGSHELSGFVSELGALTGGPLGGILRTSIAANVLAPPGPDASTVRQFMYNNAPLLVGATKVPQLLDEARASMHALQGAGEHGPGLARAVAELAPAFGTYLASAAAPVMATILAKKLVQALRGASADKTAAPSPGQEVKAPGALRAPASSAWQIGQNPPKPKTIGPNANIGAAASGRAEAKPPSKTSYYKDMLGSLYNPQRGSRLATPSS